MIIDPHQHVTTAIELFGTGRLMFGSDWRCARVAATYERVMTAIVEILGGTPADLFAGTAQRSYGLESS